MSVLFVTDAGPAVGGGHVMRCLTLAEELLSRALPCTFLATPAAAPILERFAPGGVARRAVSAPASVEDLARSAGQAADALGARLVVFDHYALSADHHRAAGGRRPTLVVDELADRRLGADLLLDISANHSAADYAGRLPGKASLLIGPQFALVRRIFGEARPAALARRAEPSLRRVLVTMGLTDVGGISERVVRRLVARPEFDRIDAVVGDAAPSAAGLAQLAEHDSRVRLHPIGADMPTLMTQADICIGAGGSTTWERCVLGLPSILVVLAENQRPNAAALEAAGATLVCDVDTPSFDQALDAQAARLIEETDLRQMLAWRSADLCDGRGATRVASACLELIRR